MWIRRFGYEKKAATQEWKDEGSSRERMEKKKFVDYNIEICKVAHFSSYVSVSVKPVYGLLFPWGKRCAAQRNATQARLLSSTTTCSSGGESNFGWRSIWWYLIAKKELWSRKRHSAVRFFTRMSKYVRLALIRFFKEVQSIPPSFTQDTSRNPTLFSNQKWGKK